MKKINLVILTFLIGCSGLTKREDEHNCRIIADFNALAKESFNRKFSTYNLSPFSEIEQCVLKEGIDNYLNELNNSKLTVVDSFYIRNFQFPDLGDSFSFVANKHGEFYFIYLPKLHRFFYGHNIYQVKNNVWELIDSLEYTIQQVNSQMLDTFLENEIFSVGGIHEQISLADNLLKEIFPHLLIDPMTRDVFIDSLKQQPSDNYNHIIETVNPIMTRNSKLSQHVIDYRIFYVRYIGYLLLDFLQADDKKLKLDIYFIPLKFRYSTYYETEGVKYRGKCY